MEYWTGISSSIQWNPLNMKLKGRGKVFILSEFHVIRTIRNTKCIAGVIFYFHVNQNFVLSEFVLSGFHCSWNIYGSTVTE